MLSVGKVFIELAADNKKANAAIDQTKKNILGLNGALGGFAKALGALAIIDAFVKGIKGVETFKRGLVDLSFVTTDSAEELGKLETIIEDIAKSTGQSREGLLEAAIAAGRFGVYARGGTEGMEIFLDTLSKAKVLAPDFAGSMEDAGTKLAKLNNILGLTDDQSLNLISSFDLVADNTAATSGEISDVTLRYGGLVNTMGKTNEEIAEQATRIVALSAATKDVGTNTEVAGTSMSKLKGIMISNKDDFIAFADAANGTGDSMKENIGEHSVLAINDLIKALSGLDSEQRTNTFKKLGINSDATRTLLEKLANSSDLLDQKMALTAKGFVETAEFSRKFDDAMKTNVERANILREKIKFLAKIIFEKLSPVISAVITGLTGLVNILTILTPAITAAVVAFTAMKIVGFVTSLISAMNLVLTTQTSILGGGLVASIANYVTKIVSIGVASGAALGPMAFFKGALIGMTTAFRAFTVALIANPIGLAIAGIIAALGLLYLAWKNNFGGLQDATTEAIAVISNAWKKFVSFLVSTWDAIKGPILATMETVKVAIMAVWGVLMEFLSGTVSDFIAFFRNTFIQMKNFFGGIVKILKGNFGGGLLQMIKATASFVKSWYKYMFRGLKRVLELIWKFVKAFGVAWFGVVKINIAIWKDVFGNWKAMLGKLLVAVGSFIVRIGRSFSNIEWGGLFNGMVNSLIDSLKDMWNAVKQWASRALEAIKNIFSLSDDDVSAPEFTKRVEAGEFKLSDDQKQGFLEDLAEESEKEVEFKHTKAAIAGVKSDLADIFVTDSNFEGEGNAIGEEFAKGLGGPIIDLSLDDLVDTASKLKTPDGLDDFLDDPGGAGGSGSAAKDKIDDAKESAEELAKVVEDLGEKGEKVKEILEKKWESKLKDLADSMKELESEHENSVESITGDIDKIGESIVSLNEKYDESGRKAKQSFGASIASEIVSLEKNLIDVKNKIAEADIEIAKQNDSGDSSKIQESIAKKKELLDQEKLLREEISRGEEISKGDAESQAALDLARKKSSLTKIELLQFEFEEAQKSRELEHAADLAKLENDRILKQQELEIENASFEQKFLALQANIDRTEQAMQREIFRVENANKAHTAKLIKNWDAVYAAKKRAVGGTAAASDSQDIPGFANGGFTGEGAKNDVAGIVHKGEYVIPKSVLRNIPSGVMGALENLRKGFSNGGFTGGITRNFGNQISLTNNQNISERVDLQGASGEMAFLLNRQLG